jgi:hypothetical protein
LQLLPCTSSSPGSVSKRELLPGNQPPEKRSWIDCGEMLFGQSLENSHHKLETQISPG